MVRRDSADRRQPGGQASHGNGNGNYANQVDRAQQANDAQTADQRRRAAIRRFALAHHPDRGGDPAVFDAGLRALRAGPRVGPRAGPAGVSRPDVTVYRKRGPMAVFAAWAARHWSRWKRPARRGRSARVQ